MCGTIFHSLVGKGGNKRAFSRPFLATDGRNSSGRCAVAAAAAAVVASYEKEMLRMWNMVNYVQKMCVMMSS